MSESNKNDNTSCNNSSTSSRELLVKKSIYITDVSINSDMDNGRAKKVFFKNIQNNWLIWAFGPNKLWDISN